MYSPHYLAQNFIIRPAGSTTVKVVGPLKGISTIGDLINLLIKFLIPLAGVLLFVIVIWGGFDILMSGGSPDKVATGRQKITAGIVGFVLLVSSYFIAKLLGYIFGVGGGII